MDLKKLKEPLGIEDIDFRVQSINKGGYATILAYKDARVDMNRLDKVVGAENWQRDHKEIKNVVYCGIGINVGAKLGNAWVWKWDAGAESFTEKQKGEASDSFKRAGFNWGIGRELYDYPLIKVQLSAVEYNFQTGKVTWEFKLKDWVWGSEFKDGVLVKLAAKDERDKLRFNWKKDGKEEKVEDKKKYDLPIDYTKLSRWERKEVREQYVKEQSGKCYYCGENLNEPPPKKITKKEIDLSLFPENFLKYPIHLQHNHDTGMTEGAVHNYCNAVLWQYDGK